MENIDMALHDTTIHKAMYLEHVLKAANKATVVAKAIDIMYEAVKRGGVLRLETYDGTFTIDLDL
jgi:hypothetical protein